MSGAHCQSFPKCMEFSDSPQPPKCNKQDCPGRRSWADVFPELKVARALPLPSTPDDGKAEAVGYVRAHFAAALGGLGLTTVYAEKHKLEDDVPVYLHPSPASDGAIREAIKEACDLLAERKYGNPESSRSQQLTKPDEHRQKAD